MTTTVLASLTVNDDDPMALAEYFRATTPLLERANARIVNRFKFQEAVVGTGAAQVVVIVEYPDIDAVRSVFESDEYRQIKSVRDRAFLSYPVSVVAENTQREGRALVVD